MEERRRRRGALVPEHAPPICAFWRGKKGPKLYLGAIRAGKERLRDFFSLLYAEAPKSQLDIFLQPASSPAPVSEGADDDDDDV